MSEFCAQCAERLDFRGDFAGLTSAEDWAEGRAAVVLCEGCGACQVDPTGRCVSPDCDERHGAVGS